MSKEGEAAFVLDYSGERAVEAGLDEIFVEKVVPILRRDMKDALALAETPEQAKSIARQVVLKHAEGRQFTDPVVVWNQERGKVFVTVETQVLVFDAQGKSREIRVVVPQVIEIKERGKKKKDVLSRYIN